MSWGVGGHEQVKMLRAQWVHLEILGGQGGFPVDLPVSALSTFPSCISAVVYCKCQSPACFTH